MNLTIKRCGAPQGSSEVLLLTTPWSGHRNTYLPNFDIVYYKLKFKTMIHLSYLYVRFFLACMHECVPCVLLVPTEVKKKKKWGQVLWNLLKKQFFIFLTLSLSRYYTLQFPDKSCKLDFQGLYQFESC